MPAKKENIVFLMTLSAAIVDVSTKSTRAVTIVDLCDLPILIDSPRRWYVKKIAGRSYVVRNVGPKNQSRTELLHRVILGLSERSVLGDHRRHDTLDNRRSQLRNASQQQNGHNSRSRVGSSSQYLGVSLTKSGAWMAQIKAGDVRLNLGCYKEESAAARAYDAAASRLCGQFANLNFPAAA